MSSSACRLERIARGARDGGADLVLVDEGVPVTETHLWWMPKEGVEDHREPSTPGDGSSVTS